MTYAKTTKVPIERTVGEIQRVLNKAGATGFAYATQENKAFIAFSFSSRSVKIKIKLPHPPSANANQASIKTYEQAKRSIWRSLLLVVKAKVESIESGIETFDEAFLPHILLDHGQTVGEKIIHKIEELNKTSPALMLGL